MYKVLRETNSWQMCPSKRPQTQRVSLAACLLRALLLGPLAAALPSAAAEVPADATVADPVTPDITEPESEDSQASTDADSPEPLDADASVPELTDTAALAEGSTDTAQAEIPDTDAEQAPAEDGSLAPEPADFTRINADLDSFRKIVRDLESGTGAYASALPEQLLSLGISLQRAGQHEEAVSVFKRGVHLSRINNGLYSAEQIALLEREIASHVAMGQYDKAEDRQHYMYRVQIRSMESGLNRAQAFMSQAQWQYNAYRLDIDGPGYPRLMSMWDLYRLALNDIVDREGQTSLSLLPPLEGMLLSQYLIGLHPADESGGFGSTEGLNAQQQANRFHAYRAQNYKKGRAVIQAIYDVQEANHGQSSRESAEALVMMGDWLFWQGESETAMEVYQGAIAELVDAGVAQEEIDQMFSEPVALPNYEGARYLPPATEPASNTVMLEFVVNEQGKVLDLERVDENEDLSSGLANRLMRKLRKTRFRPQLSMGEPVMTEKVSRAYVIE